MWSIDFENRNIFFMQFISAEPSQIISFAQFPHPGRKSTQLILEYSAQVHIRKVSTRLQWHANETTSKLEQQPPISSFDLFIAAIMSVMEHD